MPAVYSSRRHRNNRPIRGRMNLCLRIRKLYKMICRC